MVTKLTRQQLYELVWAKPMTQLAVDFAISDVALHKICRKAHVPTPPAGHWMKVAHGKRVIITPLPNPEDRADVVIRTGAAAHEPEAVAVARAEALERVVQVDPATELPAIVTRTLQCLRAAKRDREGLVRCGGAKVLSVAVRPASLDRVGVILGSLVRAGEAAGLTLVEVDGSTAWLCAGQTVSFELIEVADQVEHVPTAQELAAVAKWQREREERHRRYSYWADYGEPRIPKWEQRFQGRLAIKLEQVRLKSDANRWGETMRRTFADSRTRDVLRMVPRVIGATAAIAAAKHSNVEFEQRQRAAEEDAARRRAEAERRRSHEQKALKLLGALVDTCGEAERLEGLLTSLTRSPEPLGDRAHRFMRWATERLEVLKSEYSADQLEQRLAAEQLFDLQQPS